MKIICISEEIGIVWYTALDYKRREIHVVVYGLQVKQFNNREDAQKEHQSCLNHYWECMA